MKRAILLQTEATPNKNTILRDFLFKATQEANMVLAARKRFASASSLQTAVAQRMKDHAGFNIQIICSIVRDVWRKQKDCESIGGITVKFNVPRNSKTFKTKAFDFVELGLYPKRRIAIPIKKNRNWDRLAGHLGNGWTCKTYGLTPNLEIVAYLSKEDKVLAPRKNVLSIDVNASNFAYTILTPEGRILRQGYLGQHIWPAKVHFAERRAMLQSYNNLKALKRMRHDQRNFVKTNLGQMVAEIIKLAIQYDADVSIENLSKFKPKGRKFNKKALTIPFAKFKEILTSRCFDNGITLYKVDAYHTSKWCVRCGAVNMGHVKDNYSLYRCGCGLTMNSDRKASLAVAVKTFFERDGSLDQESFQLSGKRVPVSGLKRHVPDATEPMAVLLGGSVKGKAPEFIQG